MPEPHVFLNGRMLPASQAHLAIYDVSGRTVRTLAKQTFEPGSHSVAWDGRDARGQVVSSGVYFCRLQAGEFTATRTLVVSR